MPIQGLSITSANHPASNVSEQHAIEAEPILGEHCSNVCQTVFAGIGAGLYSIAGLAIAALKDTGPWAACRWVGEACKTGAAAYRGSGRALLDAGLAQNPLADMGCTSAEYDCLARGYSDDARIGFGFAAAGALALGSIAVAPLAIRVVSYLKTTSQSRSSAINHVQAQEPQAADHVVVTIQPNTQFKSAASKT